MKPVSERLRGERNRRHLSQEALAAALGVSARSVSRWERGLALPQGQLRLQLSRFFELSPTELFGDQEADPPPALVWNVPYPRNPFFTGREVILEMLHTQLSGNQAFALQGLGGIGKTHVALEYAYRYGVDYCAVFWVGAETNESIVSSFLDIAELLQLPGHKDHNRQLAITAVQRWLTTHERWLLIWDNAEDLTLLDQFLPASRPGSLLLTTHLQALGARATGINLAPLEQEEGVLLLLRRTKILEPGAESPQVGQFASGRPDHFATAAKLVEAMGGLPLALDQAGAYLEETQCGLPAYLELYHTRRAALLLRRGETAQDHPASVAITVHLALSQAVKRDPAVRDLLMFCAMLHPDAIPEELFCQGAAHLGAPLQDICGDPLAWDHLLAAARASSLLSRQPETHTFSLHRLVQAVILDGMTADERLQWRRRTCEALDAVFPSLFLKKTIMLAGEKAIWKKCQSLLSHALVCLEQTEEAEESLALASLASKAASYLEIKGTFIQARDLYQRALAIHERLLEAGHPLVSGSLCALAIIYEAQGYYSQAEQVYRHALHIMEQNAIPPTREAVYNLSGLAFIIWRQGQLEQAEALFQQALELLEQLPGAPDPHIAFILHSLGLIATEQSNLARAEVCLLQAHQIWEKQGGDEHPWLAHALVNLAHIYRERREFARAEKALRQAQEIWEQTLGAEHPWVAYALHGLALLAEARDQFPRAEVFFGQALALQERHLGQQHPDTARTLYDMALLRQRQGQIHEASSLAERAYKIRSQALGDGHPHTEAARALCQQFVLYGRDG